MNSVLDPLIFFISDDDWKDDDKRDEFLQHFVDNITTIDKYKVTKIYWTEALDELLYVSQLPPWRRDRMMNNGLVPIIYRHFGGDEIKEYLNCDHGLGPCDVCPTMQGLPGRAEIDDCFRGIMHQLVARDELVFLALGLANRSVNSGKYVFSCTCHPNQLVPPVIRHPHEWLWHVNLEQQFWPTSACDRNKFMTAIQIAADTLLISGIAEAAKLKYDYDFDNRFLERISSERNHRGEILRNIAKRLLLTQSDAAMDSSLLDEDVKGGRKRAGKEVRRFRVSGENRIHYIYPCKGKILFTDYYGAGEHDKGL